MAVASLTIANAKADQLYVKLDVRIESTRIASNVEDAFRAELGKLPDVVLTNAGENPGVKGVNNGDWDVYVFIRQVPNGIGRFAMSVTTNDNEGSLREKIEYNGVTFVWDKDSVEVPSGSELREFVASVVTDFNRRSFQEIRTAIATYGRKWP